MKVLVIGSGGREHVLCQTFSRQGHTVFSLPGNAGTKKFTPPEKVDLNNFDEVADFVEDKGIDLTVAGPEDFLAKGIKDIFSNRGLTLFGPRKHATKLESSKIFAKKFMGRHDIPTAPFEICRSAVEARAIIDKYFDEWQGVVLKPDGLTAGKGVMVCKSRGTAEEAVKILFEQKRYGAACNEIVIEKLLKGPECSLLAFCDGKTMIPMLPSQDHKRLLENDAGPNTGGVGAYAPAPFVTEDIMKTITEEIIHPTSRGLKAEEIVYQGVLYFGIILTNDGPKVLEYNCRFGDPEAQAVLPLLESDLAQIMLACCRGCLKEIDIVWNPGSACVVVMCSGGYPHAYQTGYYIENIDAFNQDESINIYHAGTAVDDRGQVVTAGGRVLGVAGIGQNLNEAVDKAYKGVVKISFTDAHYRRDIAGQAMISEEVKECAGSSQL
jgi:phosphoribosylamine---glycine ligase